MKKLLSTTVIILLAITVSNAQDIRYGIKGGINFASLTGYNPLTPGVSVNSDYRTSFNIGAFVEIPLPSLSDKLYGEIGLNYSQNGGKYNLELGSIASAIPSITASKVDITFKINQLNIPVFLKYELVDNLFINGGGYVGFILSSESESTSAIQAVKTENAKTFDSGLMIGTEYNLNNGLLFFANYNYGLINIAKSSGDKIKNRVFQLGVGYKF